MDVWGVLDRLLPPVLRMALKPGILRHGLQTLESRPAGVAVIAIGILLLVLALVRSVMGVANFVYAYFLQPAGNLQRYGSWAVVTGCTDGIGKAYCKALAKKGMNLVLVSRTESKLVEQEAELRAKHSIKVKHCAADLCKADDATFARLAEVLEGVDVGILVNNAGMSYDHPDYLERLSDDFLRDLITINTLAPTKGAGNDGLAYISIAIVLAMLEGRLAKLVLPGMKERRRGVIVNVGSAISLVAPSGPLLSAYTASKAYIDSFSRSLDAEAREFGVRVQNQAPMFVATKMSKIRRARLDAPTPDAWAAAAVAQIGQETSSSPYWFHGLQLAAIRLAPPSLMAGHVLRMHKAMLRAWHRKQARIEAEAAAAAAAGLQDDESSAEPKKGK